MEFKNDIPVLNVWGKMGMAVIRAFSHLPMRFLYVFADVVYFLMYWVASYRIKIVRSNLQLAFPHKSQQELRQIERKFYRHLADYFFETIKALTISDEELRRRYVIRNPELVNNITATGQSVFLYGAHIGNWEWLTVLPLTFPQTPVHTFYQRQSSTFADHMSLSVRTRRGIIAVESHKGFRHEVACKRGGHTHMTLVLGDQSPHIGAPKFWFDFMGQDTSFLVGPAHIAAKIDVALVYPSYVVYRRGYYEVEMKLIVVHPAEVGAKNCAKRFGALLEDDLARLPELWLWSHNRWKHKHADFPDDDKEA